MRWLLTALLVSLPAAGQISGALTVSDGGHLALELQCELACSPVTYSASEIDWRYSALDGGGTFVVQPEPDGGHFEADVVVTQLGTALTFTTSVSCACGALDSGVLELRSAPFPIAPMFNVSGAVLANREFPVHVQGFPQGTETIDVSYSGAGLDGGITITHAGADFTGGNTVLILKPLEAGTIALSATLHPYSLMTSTAIDVHPENVVDAGVDAPEPKKPGCSLAPGLLLAGALTLFARKRSR